MKSSFFPFTWRYVYNKKKIFLGLLLLLGVIVFIRSKEAVQTLNKITSTQLWKSKINYDDHLYLDKEKLQQGTGENGAAAKLPASLKFEKEQLYEVNGFNARLSDEIMLNRTLQDLRDPRCKSILYSSQLPTAAVIVPFHNEHLSTLLRTAMSAYNRAPKHLLKEIILVDDASSKDIIKDRLDDYVREHLPIVTVVRLKERQGLIRARLEGAKKATAEVLIFLDSHTECTTNWLPPLLEPISENYRTAVCPFIDVIDFETFEYKAQDEGRRGSFDWEFYYKRLPLLSGDINNMPNPFKSPIMAGGLFAISSRFFWELGGYDPGLDIWGGEQYELSFKIWQCHGQMLDAPCSRIGHIYRKFAPFPNPRNDNFLTRNYRRVAEVWMDDYKKYLYARQPGWLEVPTGDISEQKTVRQRNKCKSFDWFMTEVAFDLTEHYPLVEPPDYCNGTISSAVLPSVCLDSLGKGQFAPLNKLRLCNGAKSQEFQITAYKDLRPMASHNCFDVPDLRQPQADIMLYGCHKGLGNQMWKYDIKTKSIKFGHYGTHCLDASLSEKKVFVSLCNRDSKSQKWQWSVLNEERLKNYDTLSPVGS